MLLLSAWVPGALGLFLRSKLYPLILGRVGRNVAFGCNVVLRHPHKIEIDDNVVIDDQCCLDAKGTTNRGISIKRGVFLGRNTILSCKNGDIVLDEDANIGFNVEVFSAATVQGRQEGADRGVHLSGRRRSSLRSGRRPGARPGADGARHRRRRQRLARAPTSSSPTACASGATRSSAPGAVVTSAMCRSFTSPPACRRGHSRSAESESARVAEAEPSDDVRRSRCSRPAAVHRAGMCARARGV